MTYKLLALDLDGTVLGSDRTIHSRTHEAVAAVRALGVEVIIVTGRHHVATLPYYRQLGLRTPAICCNGVYLYDFDRRQVLSSDPFDWDDARKLLAHVRRCPGVHCMIYTAEAMTYERLGKEHEGFLSWSEKQPEHMRPQVEKVNSFERLIEDRVVIWKFLLSHENPQSLHRYVEEIKADVDLSYEWSWNNHVDIARKGNSKGRRLLEWGRSRGIDPAAMVAIGDNYNDVSMLSAVGMGIAMGNADDAVKAAARDVTGSNDEAGVAAAIQRHFLDARRQAAC